MTPDEDDWKKLLRIINYLRGTLELPLTLQASNTNIVKWWVDGLESQREYQGAPEVVDHSEKLLPVILIRCHNSCGEESNSIVDVRASTLSGKKCLSNICMKSLRPFFIQDICLFIYFE